MAIKTSSEVVQPTPANDPPQLSPELQEGVRSLIEQEYFVMTKTEKRDFAVKVVIGIIVAAAGIIGVSWQTSAAALRSRNLDQIEDNADKALTRINGLHDSATPMVAGLQEKVDNLTASIGVADEETKKLLVDLNEAVDRLIASNESMASRKYKTHLVHTAHLGEYFSVDQGATGNKFYTSASQKGPSEWRLVGFVEQDDVHVAVIERPVTMADEKQ